MLAQKRRLLFVLILSLVDIILINLGYLIAFIIKFGLTIPEQNILPYLFTWPWLSLTALALFCFYRLYGGYKWRWAETFASLICVVFFQALISMAISFMFRGFSFPRTVLLSAPFIQLILLSLWRRAAWYLERKLQDEKRVIVVGPRSGSALLAGKLESVSDGVITVSGIVLDSIESENEFNDGFSGNMEVVETPGCMDSWPILGQIEDFDNCLDKTDPDEVFVCSTLTQEQKAAVVYACVNMDKKVFLIPDLYEILLAQSKLEQVDDIPLFKVGQLAIPLESLLLKRVIDIILSFMAIVITSPLCALISLFIKLDSPGPVFYRQKRLTLQGRPFYLYKFRTMIDDAEQTSGPVLAEENDPRITRVGRFLRATRIDEIPQLLNVLKGDMSIVGPRPERPFFVNEFIKDTPEYAFRMNVKSGITGLAQIAGRYSTSPENKLKYDLLYTKSYSPAKDLAILFQTLKVILMKDKAS